MGEYKHIPKGTPLELTLVLEDGDTGKFPQAFVFDSSFSPVAGSPFDLTHVAQGFYKNNAFTPAANGRFYSVYKIFNEVGHSTVSLIHGQDVDSFEVDERNVQIAGLRTDYTTPRSAKIDNIDTNVTAIVADDQIFITGTLQISKPLSGIKLVDFIAHVYNNKGILADPDSSILNFEIQERDGTPIMASTAMTRISVGLYRITHSISTASPLGQHIAFYDYDFGGVAKKYNGVFDITSGDINTISVNVDAIRAKTEKLNFDGSDRVISHAELLDDKAGFSLTATDKDDIADRTWDENKAAHTSVGSFGETLDAKVSSRQGESDASNRANAAAKEVTVDAGFVAGAKDITTATKNQVDGVQIDIDGIKSKTDQMVFNGNNIRSDAQVVSDKGGYSNTAGDKNDIASRVWEQNTADHQGAGTLGKAVDDAQTATDPNVIADAVWDESASAHAAPSSMGGKLNEARNNSADNSTKNDTLLSRLSSARATKIDNLDQPISSRQGESDAASRFSDLTADIANVVTILNGIAGDVSGSDPDNLSILQLLNSATFGLAQLRIQLDAKSTLAQLAIVLGDLTAIIDNQDDGATGFAALKVALEANNSELVDSDHGLARLRTELDGKATASEFSNIPTALEIAAKIWDELTSNPRAAGSYGTLVKTNLDDKITTRATTTDLATVDTIVDDIKSLLENGAFGLNALLDEINANEVKIDANGVAIADIDSDLATARADILAAIALIIDGTPTIIAALDEIKGAGFVEATDALKAISAKIAAGTATLGNQTSILTKLNDMHGTTPAASDTIKDAKVATAQNTSEIQANNTQIRADVAVVDGKVDSNSTEIAAVKARLDDTNFGLSKAKTDRDSHRSDILAGQGTQNSKLDTIESKVDTVDGKVTSSEAAILAAISALDVSLLNTNVQGIIALLQDGTNGLSAIKNAVTQVKNQEAANSSQIVGDISSLDTKIDTLEGLLTAIQGAGFTSSESLVAIKTAVLAVSTEHVDQALESSIQLILVELNKIKDGETATFDGTTDSLTQIAKQGSQLQGFEGGEG